MSAVKSLFIPHVFPNFTRNYVAESFSEIGYVEDVDFVAKQDRNGKMYNAAYIHFRKWYNNRFAEKTLYDIFEKGSAKFYHDDSEYYWIVLPNTAKKHIPGERKPCLDLGESKSISVLKTPEMPVLKTPEKPVLKRNQHVQPTYAQLAAKPAAAKPAAKPAAIEPSKLENDFDKILDEFAEMAVLNEIETELRAEFAEMEEIDAELEKEDKEDENLISIDGRYVQTIEQENAWLHGEVAQLRAALIQMDQMYQAEAAKVRAFSTSVDL